jgi:hypothetical protein
MLLEVLCRDTDGQPYYQGGAATLGAATVTAELDYVLMGDKIEVRVKSDDGEVLGDWSAPNVYPARVVTATQFGNGVAVTDDASNTYYKAAKDV